MRQPFEGFRRATSGLTRRQLYRESRRQLYRALAARWGRSRAALKRVLRNLLKPLRHRTGLLFRIAREAGYAALVAGAVLAGGAFTAHASSPIELSTVATGTGGFILNGIDATDRSGFAVSSIGDVSGDGLADVAVAACLADPGGRSAAGEVYVVFGKSGGTAVQLSTVSAGTGGYVINGIDPNDRAGFRVAAAGDVNGDGIADLIVGAPGAAAAAGESYVLFGKSTGTAVDLTSIAAGTGGFMISGIDADDQSGYGVSGAGDVNGDGLADLIVAAPYAAPGGNAAAGECYVVFGKASGTTVALSTVAAGTGGFIMTGTAEYDYAGLGVSGGGDVNGDGLADVIVGACYADPGVDAAGITYVVFGKTTGTAVALSTIAGGTGGFAINGIDINDQSGYRVANAGDVNDDGLADVLVGAGLADPGGDSEAGESYVVFGKSSGTAVNLSAVAGGTGGYVINGIDPTDRSSFSLSSAGDVNGDGLSDAIVGAHQGDPGGRSNAGESYVVLGKTDGTAVELSAVAAGTGGFVLNGIDNTDLSGRGVSKAGDVNGDGLSDVIVGADQADPASQSNAGESYIVFSPESAFASGTYKMRSRAGDGAGGSIVPGLDFGDVARAKIDFSDNDTGSASGAASMETVVLTRSKSGVSNHPIPPTNIANAVWQIVTSRTGWASAKVTLKYLDGEITTLAGGEINLHIFTAPALSGPWTRLTSSVDTGRNEVSATVSGFSYFTVAGQSLTKAQGWEEFK